MAATALPRTCDVLVIGGGPSGSFAASIIAQKGYDVVLVDREAHPRPAVGESILPHAWKFLRMIGLAEEVRERFQAKCGGLSNWGGVHRAVSFQDFGFSETGLHVERDQLDLLLLRRSEAIGARVFERVSAREIRFEPGGDAVVLLRNLADDSPSELRARYVVDASGQASFVAAQYRLRELDPGMKFIALWGYFTGGSYFTSDGSAHPFSSRQKTPPVTTMAWLGDWSWAWHIVMKGEISVGVVLTQERARALLQDSGGREARFESFVREQPLLRSLLKGALFRPGSLGVIADFAYLSKRLTVENCLLIGDAAGFVDPINSVGVGFGFYSGLSAALAVDRCLRNQAHRSRFLEIFEHEYRARLALFRIMAAPEGSSSITPKDCELAEEILQRHSQDEIDLMYSQIVLTGRPTVLTALLRGKGIPFRSRLRDIALPEGLG